MSALDEEQSIASLDQSYLDKEQNDNKEISNYSDDRQLTSVELFVIYRFDMLSHLIFTTGLGCQYSYYPPISKM